MGTTWLRAALFLLVAGTLAGCCRRCPPCPPTSVASGSVPGNRELPEAMRQAVVRRLRVGMTFDEVRAALRPFADGEPGGLGSLGLVTFGLRDGDLRLRFEVDGGPTTVFLDGPGTGSFTDRIPPYIAGTIQDRLVAGGDFDPTRGS